MIGIELLNHFLSVDNEGGPWNVLGKHGTEMKWRPHPLLARGIERGCFHNAYNLATNQGFAYCEGLALGYANYPYHHAWCLDTKSGYVLDSTWPEPSEGEARYYYGMPFALTFVANLRKKGQFSMLDGGGGMCPIMDYAPAEWKY